MKLSFKDSPIGTLLLFVGLGFIFVGTAINFYNQMFQPEENNTTNEEAAASTSTPDDVPTDLTALSETLNRDLGVYLAGSVTASENGTDVMTLPAKRLALVNIVLENQKKSTVSNNITYVTEDVYTAAYMEVFGSSDQLQNDLTTAYVDKANVDKVIGVGNIGWTSMATVGLVRTLTATSAIYDNDNAIYVIDGTYADNQLGAAAGSGTFTITYGDNNGTKYLVGITLTANA